MSHMPIQIRNLTLSFSHKTCFNNFTTQIPFGSRIAIIGRNGCGKSTLLKLIQGLITPTEGKIVVPDDVMIGSVPQIIEDHDTLSGGEKFNRALTQVLSQNPTMLLLDEPTNHLDPKNRRSFMRMIQAYSGTLIVASHDTEFLRTCVSTLWSIDQGQIQVFSGTYDDLRRETQIKRSSLEQRLNRLERSKQDMHDKRMQEQSRTAKSKASGEKKVANRKWMKSVGDLKGMKAEKSQGKIFKNIEAQKQEISSELSNLRIPEIITPQFSLNAADMGERTLISIQDGGVGYKDHEPILNCIYLSLGSKDRMSLCGNNGCGKSTLLRGILQSPLVMRSGTWTIPSPKDIGFLDQHYKTLRSHKTVFETIEDCVPSWTHAEIRCHLNDFLFRKNEEVNTILENLSGGEKARLCLAQIAACTPKLLILDEITNNLDLETKTHILF